MFVQSKQCEANGGCTGYICEWEDYSATDRDWCMSNCQQAANDLSTDGCCYMDNTEYCNFQPGSPVKDTDMNNLWAVEINSGNIILCP